MEDALYTILGIGVALLIGILLMRREKRKRARSWQGVVTKISSRSIVKDEDDIGSYEITVKYRKDSGDTGKLSLDEHVFKQMYPGLKVGDRLIKEAGADHPRVEAASHA